MLGGETQRGEQFIPERRSQAKHLVPSLGFGDSCLPPFDPQSPKGLDCSDSTAKFLEKSLGLCRVPLLEECLQHHGHKGDPGVTPGTCGAIGERAQVILVWVKAPGRWGRLLPTETRSHEGLA